MNIETQHTVSGNPNRFETGRIEIKNGEEWRTRMKRGHRAFVTFATWPLLTKYGYPVRTSAFQHADVPQGAEENLDAMSGSNSSHLCHDN